MYAIDPTRLDLAREFRAKPYGPHSAELHAVLTRMRLDPVDGKILLVMTKPHAEWVVAQMRGTPPRPWPLSDRRFARLEDAEWFVFKMRWERITGHPLGID